ncbi:NAD(P)-dependent oxidoreductase [Plantactinospora sp. BB1]|uniref:NAD-dependent epimerase/dehydratase family protein n=1 Tax=Plantactinospora sp. BB1 TaxID=2071627 RepID=UPI000D15C685|nr:NAD-dependent epimerase/dehydratase family protein [Plantactinospora sp. BB1]AVT36407.1 NAD-dependent epimerase [Plantactinospora sp. BB1]
MATVLVTGSAGFIGGYLVEELLGRGHDVVGLDNHSKYGPVAHSYDDHPRFRFVEGDARDATLLADLLAGCDHFVAGAAMIGGISYFHTYAYDLLATNERIMAASCDAAIAAHRAGRLRKVTYLSSSMVYESTDRWPSREGDERQVPPPLSSYGFQKLAVEYYARAAWDQYRLPYTIVRPFNCVGVGEGRALGEAEVLSGNVKLAMSHVVPDLVQKVVKGQDPLRILGSGEQVRHYTYGGDLARGIAVAMEHEAAYNEDFNLSTAESTTVLELAELIWRKIKGPDVPFRYVSDEPFAHDVLRRVPDVAKAREVLGFTATTGLDAMLDEVIPWVTRAVHDGRL